MNQFIPLWVGVIVLAIGSVLGYYARQSIAKRDYKNIEAKLQKKISSAREQSETIISEAKNKARRFIEKTKRNTEERQEEVLKTERLLLKREHLLDKNLTEFDKNKEEFYQKVEKVRAIKKSLEDLKLKVTERLEKVSELSKEEAQKQLMADLENVYQKDILERMKKLEIEGNERFERKAKEIIALAIQKCALNQAQETTTTVITLPSDDIKGRIIGKEGRNIKSLENLTGVEIIVDETPEAVVISGFNPLRRQVAKIALEKLVADGRIQPARIEKQVEEAKKEVAVQIKKAGDQAVYDVGIPASRPAARSSCCPPP